MFGEDDQQVLNKIAQLKQAVDSIAADVRVIKQILKITPPPAPLTPEDQAALDQALQQTQAVLSQAEGISTVPPQTPKT